MRIGELSRRTGATIPTIKYYIREGLLPAGTRTAANQAEYDDTHAERIALIRALREVADLPIATIRETLHAIEHPDGAATGRHLGLALRALSEPLDIPDDEVDAYAVAAETVDITLQARGWSVPSDSTARAELIRAVVAINRHFPGGVTVEGLDFYARLAETVAEHEIPDRWDAVGSPTEALRYAVLGTVLYEPVILALRRLAHAERSQRVTRRQHGARAVP